MPTTNHAEHPTAIRLAVFRYRGVALPEWIQDALFYYLSDGFVSSDFLLAVLSNNLKESLGRADEESLRALPCIVSFLYGYAPMSCWGSKENVAAWINLPRNQS